MSTETVGRHLAFASDTEKVSLQTESYERNLCLSELAGRICSMHVVSPLTYKILPHFFFLLVDHINVQFGPKR